MKSSTVFSLIGLVGSALSANGVTGYVAWNNLAGTSLRVELKKNQPTAQSQMASPAPIGNPRSVVQSVAPPQNLVYSVPTASQGRTFSQVSTPQVSTAPTFSSASPAGWSLAPSARNQAENDVLYDLSQALQPVEYHRLSNGERLDIARQVQAWLYSGVDQWSLRSQFDMAYRQHIVGNYVFNREAYIKFAGERLAPEYWATLPAPTYRGRGAASFAATEVARYDPVYDPFGELPPEMLPDGMMYPEPGYEAYEMMPFEPPMGMPAPLSPEPPPPEMLPYFGSQPEGQPYGQPAPQPYSYSDDGYPDYGSPDYSYPDYAYPDYGYPDDGYPDAQRPPTGNPYPRPQPRTPIPGVTEVAL